MRKNVLTVGVAVALAASLSLSSCVGSFALTNRLLSWNKSLGNKFVNELVFFALWVLPVYEVSTLADLVVINSIEFWSGDNPMACGTKKIKGNDGRSYLVKCDGKGYDIVSEDDKSSVRLDFHADNNSWNVTLPSGDSYELFAYLDDNHVVMPDNSVVELTPSGVLAFGANVRSLQPMASL